MKGHIAVAVERELRESLDRHAIQDLINRYSDAVTRADWDQCEAVFTADAVWESPLGMYYDTRAKIIENLSNTTSNDVLIQMPHAPVVTLTGPDRAKATTTIHELCRGILPSASELGEAGAEINIEQYGIFYDDFARVDGDWKITRRIFVPLLMNTGTVNGTVLTKRSALLKSD